jgi:hypothetical protein
MQVIFLTHDSSGMKGGHLSSLERPEFNIVSTDYSFGGFIFWGSLP